MEERKEREGKISINELMKCDRERKGTMNQH
jgi:hypothetical protein